MALKAMKRATLPSPSPHALCPHSALRYLSLLTLILNHLSLLPLLPTTPAPPSLCPISRPDHPRTPSGL